MNVKDHYRQGTDSLIKNLQWINGDLVVTWADSDKANTTLTTPVVNAGAYSLYTTYCRGDEGNKTNSGLWSLIQGAASSNPSLRIYTVYKDGGPEDKNGEVISIRSYSSAAKQPQLFFAEDGTMYHRELNNAASPLWNNWRTIVDSDNICNIAVDYGENSLVKEGVLLLKGYNKDESTFTEPWYRVGTIKSATGKRNSILLFISSCSPSFLGNALLSIRSYSHLNTVGVNLTKIYGNWPNSNIKIIYVPGSSSTDEEISLELWVKRDVDTNGYDGSIVTKVFAEHTRTNTSYVTDIVTLDNQLLTTTAGLNNLVTSSAISTNANKVEIVATDLFETLSSDSSNAISIKIGNTTKNISASTLKTNLGLGSNAYTSTAYLPLTGGTVTTTGSTHMIFNVAEGRPLDINMNDVNSFNVKKATNEHALIKFYGKIDSTETYFGGLGYNGIDYPCILTTGGEYKRIYHSGNLSASVSGLTLTITINGTNYSLTNTNTATAVNNILVGTNSGTAITYAPYSSTMATSTWVSNDNNAGKLYLGTQNPSKTTRLNYNGYFYATKLYSGGNEVLTSHLSLSGYLPLTAGSSKKLSSSLYFDATNCGVMLVDSSGVSYAGIFDNGVNFWLGASGSTTTHHIGKTYISTGWVDSNKTDENGSIYVWLPKSNTYKTVAHSGNVTTGDNNGQIKIAGTNVSVKGLGTNAYSSTEYLPLAGGTMSSKGYISFLTAVADNYDPSFGITLNTIQGKGNIFIAANTNGNETEHIFLTSGYTVDNCNATNGLAIGSDSLTWKNVNVLTGNLNYTSSGRNYKVQKDSSNNLYVNVPSDNSHYTAIPILGNSNATSNATSDTTNTTTYLNIIENNVKSGGILIKGDGKTTVKAKDGILTINSTWRGILDNLTSTSTTDSLSANQGKILNDTFNSFYSLSKNYVTAISKNDNLNDYTTPGVFTTTGGSGGSTVAESLTNKPSFDGGFRLYVQQLDKSTTPFSRQIIYTYGGRWFYRNSGSNNNFDNVTWHEIVDSIPLSYLETTLTNSDTKVSSSKAVKTYVDSAITSGFDTNNALVFKGTYTASSSTTISTSNLANYGSTNSRQGWLWVVTGVTGSNKYFGNQIVENGDLIISGADNPGTTASNYYVILKNIDPTAYVTLSTEQIITGNKTFGSNVIIESILTLGKKNTSTITSGEIKMWAAKDSSVSPSARSVMRFADGTATLLIGYDCKDIPYVENNTDKTGFATNIYGQTVSLNYGSSRNSGLYLDSSGRVGIANSNPGYRLDVTGSINASTDIYEAGTKLSEKYVQLRYSHHPSNSGLYTKYLKVAELTINTDGTHDTNLTLLMTSNYNYKGNGIVQINYRKDKNAVIPSFSGFYVKWLYKDGDFDVTQMTLVAEIQSANISKLTIYYRIWNPNSNTDVTNGGREWDGRRFTVLDEGTWRGKENRWTLLTERASSIPEARVSNDLTQQSSIYIAEGLDYSSIDWNRVTNKPNYAASTSQGGAATSANKLNGTELGQSTKKINNANWINTDLSISSLEAGTYAVQLEVTGNATYSGIFCKSSTSVNTIEEIPLFSSNPASGIIRYYLAIKAHTFYITNTDTTTGSSLPDSIFTIKYVRLI